MRLSQTPESPAAIATIERRSGPIGELAAAITTDRLAQAGNAATLLTGYAGEAHSVWAEGRIAAACAGAAEMVVLDDLVVAVDGRLDNAGELAQLTNSSRTSSVAELLAYCWRRLGAETVDRMVGELAGFIVERGPARVHAFRDICAGRPLHVTHQRDGWALASEWRPLVTCTGGDRAPNPEWFASAFTGHSVDARATPYAGIDMVLPGHVASPSQSGWRQVRAARWHVPHLHSTQAGAYAEQFRHLFDEAVRCRIDGAERVGVALSGGLDSTSVLASAYAVRPDAGRVALCVPMQEPAGDERAMQAHMADRCASELRWVDITGHGPLGSDGPDAVFGRFGAPPLTINWYFGDAVAEEARAAGLSVVLDGEDGDGSVGGSRTFLADLLVTGRWLSWYREVNTQRALGSGSGREMLRDSLYLSAPPAWRRAYLKRVGANLAPDVLAEGLRSKLNLEDRLQRAFLNRSWALGRVFRQAQGQVGIAEQIGPVLTTISEPWRRRGVLLTHPWSDRRLMSFCMGLPYMHVQKGGMAKLVLRQAMADRLPPGLIAHNGKADLSEVVVRAARGPERPYLLEGLRLARSQPEWFDATAVAAIESDFESGKSVSPAVRVAMFASWLRWCSAE